jgi:signal transduction histidine kinase
MLSYLIVRYHAFNIKLIATQVLVAALWFLTLAILFLRNIATVRVVVFITLGLFTILGYLLVRSVEREVALREELEIANEGQANLIHIINHQIKGYLAKARNIFSELLTEPGYGACTNEAKPMLEQGFNSLTEGVTFVTDFLHASNIEKGEYVYNMVPIDFRKIVEESTSHLKGVAGEKGLKLELHVAEGEYNTKGDIAQLNQAVRNLVDNSIKYTPSGSVDVHLERNNNKILMIIKDTGIGISNELKPRLFTKGGKGKDSLKINVNSTGFGLAFVKSVAEAHQGRVWAESEGEGKGSTFSLELPVV